MYWALIVDGRVTEITDIDPKDRYPIELDWRECPDGTQVGDTYSDGIYAPYVPPPPTPAEVLATQSAKLQQLNLLAAAQKTALTNRVGTLQDAVELEMATPDELVELPLRQAQLVEWKRYAVLLGRVTTQPGWPPEVTWPVQPAQGMDLTVSAVSRPTVQAS